MQSEAQIPAAVEEIPGSSKKAVRKKTKRGKSKGRKRSKPKSSSSSVNKSHAAALFPRHSVNKALRIPRAILEQNAGKECPDAEAAGFIGLKLNGPVKVEISSALKYGFLERPTPGLVRLSSLGRKVLRPQQPKDELEGLRDAVLRAPEFSDVYKHYRGENLPDNQFLDNALVDTFNIPAEKVSEFKSVFLETLHDGKLLEEHSGKFRVLDVSQDGTHRQDGSDTLKKLGKAVSVDPNDSCFVVMPFAAPLGNHYSLVYEPAIKKAGLKPVRADADIFATGKIIDQVWGGINAAKVLVAELTSRNPNVLYELGLAHALKKPVVLISSNEEDVPFDVRHIRVIYYDVTIHFGATSL